MPTAAIHERIDKIRQIVRLKQLMKRWRALGLRRTVSAPAPDSSGRAVRSGFLAVYVGPDRRRFVIPTRFLNFPVFVAFLEMAEEEYGFQPAGGLALPCEVALFRWVIDALDRDEERFKGLGLDGFVRMFSDLGLKASVVVAGGSCKDESGSSAASAAAAGKRFSPLLGKTRV